MKKKLLAGALAGICAVLYAWCASAEKSAHQSPDYPLENIEPYLEKETLTKKDYQCLFAQTGLGPGAVDALCSAGRQRELLTLQQNFFKEVEVSCAPNTVISRAEVLVRGEGGQAAGQEIPVVEKGDILIHFNCHVLGWRSGHAGIVIDEEKGRTLEARVPGMDTAVLSLEAWEQSPSFAVLRLRDVSGEERAKIADYAAEHLLNVPYRISAGVFGKKGNQNAGTQCAHLVWSAYAFFGYDLDSDGGLIVTPRDLFDSSLLETVQIYGMERM